MNDESFEYHVNEFRLNIQYDIDILDYPFNPLLTEIFSLFFET